MIRWFWKLLRNLMIAVLLTFFVLGSGIVTAYLHGDPAPILNEGYPR